MTGSGEQAIDRRHLSEQTAGDADLAREILDLFAGQCRRLLPGIGDAARPFAERADLAHTLRGSAVGVGAARVGALSGRVEAALRGGAEPAADLAALEAAAAEALREAARMG